MDNENNINPNPKDLLTKGPGEVDIYAVEDWLSITKQQPLQKLYKPFKLLFNAATGVQTLYVTQKPEYWVINYSSLSIDPGGLGHMLQMYIGQTQDYDEALVVTSAIGNQSSPNKHIILPGRNKYLYLNPVAHAFSPSLSIAINGTVYAIAGVPPEFVGCLQ